MKSRQNFRTSRRERAGDRQYTLCHLPTVYGLPYEQFLTFEQQPSRFDTLLSDTHLGTHSTWADWYAEQAVQHQEEANYHHTQAGWYAELGDYDAALSHAQTAADAQYQARLYTDWHHEAHDTEATDPSGHDMDIC